MQNIHLLVFSVPCAPLSMLGSPGGTGCSGVHFPIHRGWNSRDVSVASKCDCVKECVSFVGWGLFVML